MNNLLNGRHGADQLSLTLAIIGLCLVVGAPAFGETVASVLIILGIAIIIVSLWRIFSKDNARRTAENDKFLSIFKSNPQAKAERQAKKEKDRKLKEKLKTHEMFYCPNCHSACFVPKGKGKVRITCPKCGEKFIGKT